MKKTYKTCLYIVKLFKLKRLEAQINKKWISQNRNEISRVCNRSKWNSNRFKEK